jgi:hypothetical protein
MIGAAAVRPPAAAVRSPVVRGCRFFLAHTPGLVRHGSRPHRDIARDSTVAAAIDTALRPFAAARDYPPNQVLLGGLDPGALAALSRPWFAGALARARRGPHGEIATEDEFLALMKTCDQFDLLALDRELVEPAGEALARHPLLSAADLGRLGAGATPARIAERLAGPLPAVPLVQAGGRRVGCLVAGHEEDPTLAPDVLLENLASKATATMALRGLLAEIGEDPDAVDYVINTGEEAVGDRYQRGGGNLAKAVAEQSGCRRATGVDVKGFCCGPVHGLVIAASLVAAGVFERVAVVAGCSLAKLGMKYQGHLRAGQPVLEDTLAGFAALLGPDDGHAPHLRLDALGRHAVAAGSSQKAIVEHLVGEPLRRLGLKFRDVDRYATELHNPELTEPSGSGNVPLLNYRLIGGLAALAGEIAPAEVEAFVAAHGLPGFAPTQGHIASAIPYLAHALADLREGRIQRAMFLAKGSLFLGRMTQMADGMSFLLEANR